MVTMFWFKSSCAQGGRERTVIVQLGQLIRSDDVLAGKVPERRFWAVRE